MEKKTRFHISNDELEHRTQQQEKLKYDPGRKAAAILEAAVDKVLKSLGVNVEIEDTIAEQMNQLGIVMTENTEESTPQLNGFFIYLLNNRGDLIPHSWIGAARLNHLGECFCDIQYFLSEKLDEVGGVKLIG